MVLPRTLCAGELLQPSDYSWLSDIRQEHPRVFLTSDDIPDIRKAAKTFERTTYVEMVKRVKPYLSTPIEFKEPFAPTGESRPDRMFGYYAADAAMIWLIDGDRAYLDLAKKILAALVPYYEMRVRSNLNIEWYMFSQMCALCAYDWIYNELTEKERENYGKRLFNVMQDIAWLGPGIRKGRFRENISDYKSGCYGIASLPWFIGLTFAGEGYDDQKCEKFIRDGYDIFQQMSAFRAGMMGNKGGGASAVAQYSLGYYPYAEYDLIYTFRSAFGRDITENMDYMLGYLNFMDWIRLPGNREYGFGDVNHYDCLLPHTHMNAHVSEIANLFGRSHPEIMPTAARLMNLYNKRRPMDGVPFMRLLHKVDAMAGGNAGNAQSAKVMNFDTMGQIYMRSGTGDNDTYALFVSGGIPEQHKHYDNNNFIIYKNGYRALDSGSRPEPGNQLNYYYCRTVAHNCVTIMMPGETFPEYWGMPAANEEKDLPIPNDGGQNKLLGSKLLALKETDDYVYIASDATAAYNADKADLVVREFIWFEPDMFLVFDRIVSDKAEYEKSWLLHTAGEIIRTGKSEVVEVSRGGKTICRTLFPKKARLELIGGEGRQFWSGGRNWPMPVFTPDDYGYTKRNLFPPDTHPEVGQWRLEVRPPAGNKCDFFMHMIKVGEESMASMPSTKTFDKDGKMGVVFKYDKKTYTVTFDKAADFGCDVDVVKAGNKKK